MSTEVILAKTFTELQRNTFDGVTWEATSTTPPIDNLVNVWVRATGSVIVGVYPSVEHISTPEEGHMTRVRYIVTYTEPPEAQPDTERAPADTRHVAGPTHEEIAAAVKQVALNKAQRTREEGVARMTAVEPDQLAKLSQLSNVDRSAAAGKVIGLPSPVKQDAPKSVKQAAYIDESPTVEEKEPWQETQNTARMEAELLASELQSAIVQGSMPKSRKGRNSQHQTVVKNPTPPIKVRNQEKAEKPTIPAKLPPALLNGIPTRRSRRSS